MVSAAAIAKFLNKELNVKRIKDSSKNGLQINAGKDVKRVGFAVDACLSTFEKAKKAKVDLLIVHHGLFWKPQKYKEITKQRADFLKKNKISLYAAHLPLDAHSEYGNNSGLARILNLKDIKKFGEYHGEMIGYKGKFKKKTNLNEIAVILNKRLKTKSKVYDFGKKSVSSIGIVSGAGASSIEEAAKEKLDCFLVGEMNLSEYHRARDLKLSTVAAGHYATETVGVKALMQLINKNFKVKTIFVDNKTGI